MTVENHREIMRYFVLVLRKSCAINKMSIKYSQVSLKEAELKLYLCLK